MSADAHPLDLLPAYALGNLEASETVLVSEHLRVCSTCRAELSAYLTIIDQLALAAPDAVPAANLKDRLIARIQPPSQATTTPSPGASWWQSLIGLMQSRSPAWVGAGLLVILALVVGNLLVWQRVKRPDTALQPGAMQVVSLAGTQVAPGAAGLLVVSSDGEYGSLTVENLPPLAPKQRYQLWLIGGGKRDSGAIFSVDHHGYYATEVFAPEPLAIYSTFCITIEPAGGSPQPTGDEVLTSVELPLNCSS